MNQRRLVQEVWDKGIIHRMLGIKPSTLVSDPEPASKHRSSFKRTREGEDSVRSAWEEADAGLDADGPHNKEPEEELSRYDIDSRQQPPRKRKRVDAKMDEHIYISDDDDEEDEYVEKVDGDLPSPPARIDGSVEEPDAKQLSDEENEYDIGDSDEDDDANPTLSQKARRTRSYWLSKGVDVDG